MPKQTFYNLPADKRERVAEAIRQEFSRVPVSQVSVNRIISDAGIPRGSFYQYFKDKDDLVRFVVSITRRRVLDLLEAMLQEDGDIFVTLDRLFCHIVDLYQTEDGAASFRNIYLRIALGDLVMASERRDVIQLAQQIGANCRGPLRDWAPQDLMAGVDLLYTAFKSSLLQLCEQGSDAGEIRSAFQRKLSILEKAVTAHSN